MVMMPPPVMPMMPPPPMMPMMMPVPAPVMPMVSVIAVVTPVAMGISRVGAGAAVAHVRDCLISPRRFAAHGHRGDANRNGARGQQCLQHDDPPDLYHLRIFTRAPYRARHEPELNAPLPNPHASRDARQLAETLAAHCLLRSLDLREALSSVHGRKGAGVALTGAQTDS
jgi:hypothetical protein